MRKIDIIYYNKNKKKIRMETTVINKWHWKNISSTCYKGNFSEFKIPYSKCPYT